MTFVVGAVGDTWSPSELEHTLTAMEASCLRDTTKVCSRGGEAWRIDCGTPESLKPLLSVAEDGRFTVLFMGFTFGAQGEAATAAQSLLADAVSRDGRIQPPKGHYTLVVADGMRQELRAYVDHLATAPLYYHEWRGRTYFASQLKALLPVGNPGKRWNPEVLLQSYLLGFAVDDATVCREVDCLPGGTCLVMRSGEDPRVERYHEMAVGVVGQTSLCAFQERSAEYLEGGVHNVQATFRRLGCFPLATVSGGLDSRAVLAMLRHAGAADLVTIGWGQPGSDDAEIGAAVADIVGARHLSRPYSGGSWMLDVMDEAVDASECMHSYLDAARIQQLLRDGLPEGRGPLYTGLSGDMVMGSFVNWRDLLHRRENTDLPGLARRIAVEYTNVSFFGFDCFATHLGRESVERLVGMIRGSLEASLRPGESFYNHLDRWNLRNKQARGIFSYYRSAAAHIPVFSPFYDPDLIDVVRGLPVRYRFAEAAYAQYLIERVFDEDMLRLPWQKSGTRLRRGLYRNVTTIWARKVSGKLRAGQRPSSPFLDPTNANPYSLWLRQDRALRERIYEGLTQQGSAALLQVDEKRLHNTMSRWLENPEPYTAIDLNLIYMLSVVRFADRYGRYLSLS